MSDRWYATATALVASSLVLIGLTFATWISS